MKKQLIELVSKMQNIVNSNRKKKKYGVHLFQGMDQKIKEEMEKQEYKIGEMKKEIFDLKKENQYTYD